MEFLKQIPLPKRNPQAETKGASGTLPHFLFMGHSLSSICVFRRPTPRGWPPRHSGQCLAEPTMSPTVTTVHTPRACVNHGRCSCSRAPQDFCPFQLMERRPRQGDWHCSQVAQKDASLQSFQLTQWTLPGNTTRCLQWSVGIPTMSRAQVALRSPISSTDPSGVRGLLGWLKVQDGAGVSL